MFKVWARLLFLFESILTIFIWYCFIWYYFIWYLALLQSSPIVPVQTRCAIFSWANICVPKLHVSLCSIVQCCPAWQPVSSGCLSLTTTVIKNVITIIRATIIIIIIIITSARTFYHASLLVGWLVGWLVV